MRVANVLPGFGHSALSAPRSVTGVCLLLLVAADAAFIAVHLVHKHTALLPGELYSISRDGGFGEIFQYVKLYWVTIMLALLWARTRERAYAAWMLVFGYLLCDDALRIHERLGGRIARWMDFRDGLIWAKDQGELVVYAAFGLALLGVIALAYLRGTPEARRISHDFALLFVLLAFFAVLVDVLHAMEQTHYIKHTLGTVEDGGEMLVTSLMCWYVLGRMEGRSGGLPGPWQAALHRLSEGRLRSG